MSEFDDDYQNRYYSDGPSYDVRELAEGIIEGWPDDDNLEDLSFLDEFELDAETELELDTDFGI